MATLGSKRRAKLKNQTFAIPSQRKYPIPDERHAANALARVSQFGTAEERQQVRDAVCRRYPGLPYCQANKQYGKK